MKNIFQDTFAISKLLPRTGKPASTPGTVKYVGKARKEPVRIELIDYDEQNFTERELTNVAECLPFKDSPTVTWVNISGVHDEGVITNVGELLKVHPLVLEDIANTTQRPKLEEFDDHLFVILKMTYFREKTRRIVVEQVSLLVGHDYLISFQEKRGDVFESLRNRIRNSKGRIRRVGSDYLLYGLVDSIIDHYFSILEHLGTEIEVLEDRLMHVADRDLLNRVYFLKQELVYLRKSIWPMRDVINSLHRAEHRLIKSDTTVYFRDVYDHTVQVMETVETFRDMASGLLDLYLTTVSNKMNEVMKVLTIFAAIFIPLTFIAGVYGMNFEFMPELKSELAYPIWWVVATVMTIGMLIFFKRKKWL